MKTNVTGKHLNTYFIVTCMYMTGTGMALQYINIFMTDHLMIGAAMVSTVLLIAKIMDLVISMMAGGVVKKVRFKNNQYLSWFKIIRWILLIGFGTAFFNSNLFHLPESIRALLVAIGYITFGTGMSFLMIALSIAGISMLSISFVGGMSKYMFTLCTCLFTAAMYLFTSFGVNYFIDCGEYGYYKTGQDNRVIAMSMYNIPMKIGFMVGGSLGGYGLAFIGYHAGMAATAEFIDKFLILLGAAPAVLLFIGVAAAHFGYKITDEDAAMYANANQHGNPSHT